MERRLYNGDVSLEDPLYGGGEDVMDTIGTGEDIEETVAEKEKKEMLQNKLMEFKKLLNEKERFILEHRIMAEEPITLRRNRRALPHFKREHQAAPEQDLQESDEKPAGEHGVVVRASA